MLKEQEGKKLALFFSLACQDGNLSAVIDSYTRCEQIDRSYLETLYPLHSAVRAESLPAVQFLLDKGFNYNSRNNSKQTPLFLAASSGQTDIVRTLIQVGAEVDLADSRGWTPLMVAVKNNNASLTRILVKEGKADPKAQDKYGKNAFDKVSSVDILNALRCLDDEEAALRNYAKPKEEQSNMNEMFVLRDLVNQELDNLSKDEFGVIAGKLKEKFLQHSRNLGLDVSEKAFRKILTDLDAKLAGYTPLLVEETTKNFNQKYRKFAKEIEKYLNLKLNIAIAAYNSNERMAQNNSLYLHDLSFHGGESGGSLFHSPSEDLLLKSFQSPVHNSGIKLTTPHHKVQAEQQALNEYASPPNNHMKPLLSPSSSILVREARDLMESEGMRARSSHNSRRNTPLCRRSARKIETEGYEASSKSPQRKRFMSEEKEKVGIFKKKEDHNKMYQLMVNQTDKMVEVITDKSEVALEKIFDAKLGLLKETIDRDLQEKFKGMVGFIKGMIEERIVSAVRENIRPSRLNTMRGEKKPTKPEETVKEKEEKVTPVIPVMAVYKPLGEIRNGHTPVKRPEHERTNSNEKNLSPSYKQQREEFIRKRIEMRMNEQSASPQRELETPKQQIKPTLSSSKMNHSRSSQQLQRKSFKGNQENQGPRTGGQKSSVNKNTSSTPKAKVGFGGRSTPSANKSSLIINNQHKNAMKLAQEIVDQNTEVEQPERDTPRSVQNSAQNYQYSIQRQTKNGVALFVPFKNHSPHEIFPIPSEGSECVTESSRTLNQVVSQNNVTPSVNYSFQPHESNTHTQGENDEDSLELTQPVGASNQQATMDEKEYQMNCLKAALEKASYFDSNTSYVSSRNSYSTSTKGAAETAETKETKETKPSPMMWKVTNYERKNLKA